MSISYLILSYFIHSYQLYTGGRTQKAKAISNAKIMVHPIIKYAASDWDPRTSLSNINKLESIQRRAARVCYNDFLSVNDILSFLNLPLLATRRAVNNTLQDN